MAFSQGHAGRGWQSHKFKPRKSTPSSIVSVTCEAKANPLWPWAEQNNFLLIYSLLRIFTWGEKMTFERLISLINPSLPLKQTTATEQPQAVCYVSSQEMRQNLNFPTNLIL